VLWTTFLFAGVFACATGFQREAEEGTFDALLLSPVSPTVVFLGKLLSNLLALIVIEFALLIAATILFDEPLLTPELVAIVMLGTAGYVSLTTLLGTLGSGPRTRAVLLPVMALPLLVPMLIAAVRATGDSLGLFGAEAPWLFLLGVFAMWSALVAVILFPLAVER
jgi:heme exporter protein B